MADAIIPFGHTGKFTITTGIGGVVLQAVLTVPPNSSSVTGHGTLSQAVNPPWHGNTAFHGVVHVIGGLPPAPPKQVYSLTGVPVPPSWLVPYVSHLTIVLDGIWGTKGRATYTYFKDHGFHPVKDAEVTVQWLLQEG
jgi:hypothetical protein